MTASPTAVNPATQSFALYFHLLPAGEEEKALKMLVKQIHEKNDHVSTGIFGTKYMLEVLSEHGLSDLACKMALQKDFPGWGNMLEKGATTLWEHWDYSDNTFSHNHPMFGSISGWFHNYLAGIRPAEDAVGYDKIVLQPGGFGQITGAAAKYWSPHGTVASGWGKVKNIVHYKAIVPENTSAIILLPYRAPIHVGPGFYQYDVVLPQAQD